MCLHCILAIYAHYTKHKSSINFPVRCILCTPFRSCILTGVYVALMCNRRKQTIFYSALPPPCHVRGACFRWFMYNFFCCCCFSNETSNHTFYVEEIRIFMCVCVCFFILLHGSYKHK